MDDRLRTGANARLQVTFHDKSSLTLGENANVVIDRFVFDPNKSSANVVLNATQGALRFAGGKIEQMRQKNIVVNTPTLRSPCVAPTSGLAPFMGNMACCFSRER